MRFQNQQDQANAPVFSAPIGEAAIQNAEFRTIVFYEAYIYKNNVAERVVDSRV